MPPIPVLGDEWLDDWLSMVFQELQRTEPAEVNPLEALLD